MNGDWLRAPERFYSTALDQHTLPFCYAHCYDAEYGGLFASFYADGHQQGQKNGGIFHFVGTPMDSPSTAARTPGNRLDSWSPCSHSTKKSALSEAGQPPIAKPKGKTVGEGKGGERKRGGEKNKKGCKGKAPTHCSPQGSMVQPHSIQRNGAQSYATTRQVSNKQFKSIEPNAIVFEGALFRSGIGTAFITRTWDFSDPTARAMNETLTLCVKGL